MKLSKITISYACVFLFIVFNSRLFAQGVWVDEENQKIFTTEHDGYIRAHAMENNTDYSITSTSGRNGLPDFYHVIETSNSDAIQRFIVALNMPSVSEQLKKLNSSNQYRSLQQKKLLINQLLQHREAIELQQNKFVSSLKKDLGAIKVHRNLVNITNAVVISVSHKHIDFMRQMPNVRSVQKDNVMRTLLTQSVSLVKGHEAWRLTDKNDMPLRGDGVTIAVLDTGVDYTHPALGGCLGQDCKVVGGYDFVDDDEDPMDVHSHGTHVASISSGESDVITGIAPGASILAVKVLDDNGIGFESDVVAGVEFALDPDGDLTTDDSVDIINLSLGSNADADSLLNLAVESAFQSGVLVVAAAGNSASFQSITSPGDAQNVLTVGNTNKNDIPSLSTSKGPVSDTDYIKPEIAAPGSQIFAAIPGGDYQYKSGTSMAAPHVSGAAAILLQAEPELTAAELKSRLISGATRLDYEPYIVGSGRLDVLTSLNNSIYVDKTLVHLGIVNHKAATWQTTVEISFSNSGVLDQTLALSLEQVPSFISASTSVSEFVIPAGETVLLDVYVSLDVGSLERTLSDVGTYYFSISASNEENALTIPVMFQNVFELVINHDGNIHNLKYYSDNEDDGVTFVWDFNNPDNSKTILVPYNNVNLMFEMRTRGHELDDNPWGENLGVPSTFGAVIKKNVDIKKTSTINVSQEDLIHKISTDNIIVNGETIDFSDYKTRIQAIEFYDGDRFLTNIWYYRVCPPEDCVSNALELYLSEMPDDQRFEVFDSFVHSLDDENTNIIRFTHNIENVTGSRQNRIEFVDEPVVVDWNFKELDDVSINMDSYIENFYGNKHSLNIYSIGKLTNVPFYNVKLSTKDSENPQGNSREIASTGRMSGSEAPLLEKYQYADSTWTETEVFSTTVGKINSFNNTLRYWSARTDDSTPSFLAMQRMGGYAYSPYDYAFVRDIHENSYFAEYGVTIENCDGETKAFNNYENHWNWNENYAWVAILSPCNVVNFTYGIGEETRKATALYQSGAVDVGFPEITSLSLRNEDNISETITNSDNTLTWTVTAADAEIADVQIAIRSFSEDTEQEWQIVYEGGGAGQHTVNLPVNNKLQDTSLRIFASTAGGNTFTNTIPAAFKLGIDPDLDSDGDGTPDYQDEDNDNDGYLNTEDAFPYDETEWLDTDGDGIGNNEDSDDDNDGVNDEEDVFPLDENDWADSDNDGIGDNSELPVFGDFDGDGKADVALRDAQRFIQYIKASGNQETLRLQFGLEAGDIPIVGDFDGDGISDVALRRPSNGTWYVLNSSDNQTQNIEFGRHADDIPVPADYDGDGITDAAILRMSNLTWYVRQSSNRQTLRVSVDMADGDIPVPADYDGDGKDDIAYRRPSDFTWYVHESQSNLVTSEIFGKKSSDIPVPADYDGDGKADIAVRRPSNFHFYIRNSSDNTTRRELFGKKSEDIPIVADYDGDGKADVAVRRASSHMQYILRSRDNEIERIQFGRKTDYVPLLAPLAKRMNMISTALE